MTLDKVSHWPEHQTHCSKTLSYLDVTADYMLKNFVLPEKIETIKGIQQKDAMETLGQVGWPRTVYPDMEVCPICECQLGSAGNKRQKTKTDECYLFSRNHCIAVIILSKKCKVCSLIIQAPTLHLGLLNVGDTALLTLDIMYQMQNLVRFVFFVIP